MTQEQMAQASAIRGAFNESGHIGHHKTLLRADAHHAQIGVQSGERVVCNFGARIGNGGNECGLACIGHAQQSHIGQDLQLQLEFFFLARPAGCFLTRRTIDGALKTHIPKATIAALGNHENLARL